MTRDTAPTSGEHESCADFLDRIVYLLDNELDDADCAAVRLHLDTCNPCLKRYDLQRTVKAIDETLGKAVNEVGRV